MSNIKLYIGSEQADFSDNFNATFSIGDFRDIRLGNNNKSYTLNLPLTKTNKRLLKFSNDPSVRTEVTGTGILTYKEMIIIKGKVIVLSITDKATVLISADDWLDRFNAASMRDLDLTAFDYTFNAANVLASWSAANAFYVYPMIYFGKTIDNSIGAAINLLAQDFLPMFRLYDLLTALFSPWTISSTFINAAFFKTIYLLGEEIQSPDSFIENKDLDMRVNLITDNEDHLYPHPSYTTQTIAFTKEPPIFGSVVLNEGLHYDYPSDTYIVPENGTYKFDYTINIYTNHHAPTFNAIVQSFRLYVKRNRSAVITTIYDSGAKTDFLTTSYTTGYITLQAGDIIYLRVVVSSQAYNNTPGDENVDLYLMLTSKIVMTMTKAFKLFGTEATVHPDAWLPDIKQIDFIRGIRDAFNLRFFVDRFRQVVYIEPADTFFTDNVTDITSYIDYTEEPVIEQISGNYKEKLILKWINDTSDKAVEEYLKSAIEPYTKTIALTSEYNQQGVEDIINNCFAAIPKQIPVGWGLNAWSLPAIFGSIIESEGYPYFRSKGWKPRLFEWKGLTANPSGTWSYEGTPGKATYPKAEPLDMTTLYSSYFLRSFHWIDKGKIVTVRAKLPVNILNQFMTVVNTATSEGFRATYKLMIKEKYYYGIVNKITTNGEMSELEILIKQ